MYFIIKLFFTLSVLCAAIYSFARDELSHSKLITSIKSNSENSSLKTSTFNFQNNRRDIFWPYEHNNKKSIDFGLKTKTTKATHLNNEYDGNSLSIIIARKNSKSSYFQLSPGFHSYQSNRTIHKKYILNSDLYKIINNFKFHINYKNDYEYENFSFEKSPTSSLTSNTLKTFIIYSLSSNINISANQELKRYSDHNRYIKHGLEFSYQAIFHNIDITYGIAGKYEESSKKNLNYFSPNKNYSLGPQLNFELTLSKYFQISNSTSYENTTNVNGDRNFDLWNELNLSFFQRDSHNLAINYQSSIFYDEENWAENTLALTINLFL